MELHSKQKKILIGFFLFLGLMWLCTLISKSVYASGLAQVTTVLPERKSIEHRVEAQGTVKQGSEAAVHTLAGLRVEKILVREGDTVEADTVLFRIDLADLEEKRKEKELAVAKLAYQLSDLKTNEQLAGQERSEQQKRAQEDYAGTQSKAASAVDRAAQELASAQEKLNQHLDRKVSVTPQEERDKAHAAYEDWTSHNSALIRQEKEKQARAQNAAQQVENAQNAVTLATQKLAEATAGQTRALQQVAEAEEKVRKAEENLAGATPSPGGTPDPALQQALDDARAALAEAQAALGTAEAQTGALQQESDAAAAALTAAQDALAAANAENEAAIKEREAWQASPVEKPDYSAQDSAKEAWESGKDSLEDNVKSAEYAMQDAAQSSGELLKEAERKTQDTQKPEKADSQEEILKLELESLREEIQKYRELEEAEGNITGGIEGCVTSIRLTPGERTPDGAAILCADASKPYRFEAVLTKEQKKYVNQGDPVSLKLATGKTQKLTVDYLTEEENSPGSYRAIVNLPGAGGALSMSGTLVKSVISELYDCCIPTDALYSENNGTRYYVYTAQERDGILGKELYVSKKVVKVLEQNEDYAALEPGLLSSEDQVILASDKEIKENDVIRFKDL